ncbi:hypothetical protein OH77DRAFT_1046007 [Trametes cingulata]|nr:hypothetical protein OH77DRAFT_1046007 [Trametes cingulata]
MTEELFWRHLAPLGGSAAVSACRPGRSAGRRVRLAWSTRTLHLVHAVLLARRTTAQDSLLILPGPRTPRWQSYAPLHFTLDAAHSLSARRSRACTLPGLWPSVDAPRNIDRSLSGIRRGVGAVDAAASVMQWRGLRTEQKGRQCSMLCD